MQGKIIAIGVTALALAAGACASETPVPKAIMPGSYASVAVTDAQVMAAAAFAIDAQIQAMAAAGETAALELVSILTAEQQVVSGVNYRLKLHLKRNGAEQTANAVVWWQAWRQPDPYQLTSWNWK
jgi:hypothetical protein